MQVDATGRRCLFPIIVLLTFSAASSCGGEQATGPTTPVTVVASVEVNAEKQTVAAIGDTVRFVASARDENDQIIHGQSFQWSSTNAAVARVDPNTGLVTAVGNGSNTIRATAGGVIGSLAFSVEQLVDRVVVQPNNLTLTSIGAWAALSAAAQEIRNGHEIQGKMFDWNSSDSDIVTVDTDGRVTAAANGSATVSAMVNAKSGQAIIQVDQLALAVVVTPASDTLHSITDTVRFSAEVFDGEGNRLDGAALSWSSAMPAVASVDSTGLVTALGNGTATVQAKVGTASGSATIAVQQRAVLVSIASHRDTLVAIGDTLQLAATAYNAKGLPLEGVTFVWESTDEAVAAVDGTGVVSAAADGSVLIMAARDEVADTTALEVQQRVATIQVEPNELLLTRGDTAQLSATGINALGHPVSSTTWTWSSSNVGVVNVDQAGSLQVSTDATAGNNAQVIAEYGGVSGAAQLRVIPEFSMVVGGQNHSCGLTDAGATYCWGQNYGLTPTPLAEGTAFVTLAAGGNQTCGLTSTGSAYCSLNSLVETDLTFTAIAVGADHKCALTTAGEAYCWGDNQYGQMGDSTAIEPMYYPPAVWSPSRVTGGHTFKAIAAGHRHTCAIDYSNTAYCWGYNDRGQTGGAGGLGALSYPRPVYGTHEFESITTLWDHTCALDTAGRAFCWGYNGAGQIGNGVVGGIGAEVDHPTLVTGGLTFLMLETGTDHTCGLTVDGEAFCWGQGEKLGAGSYEESGVPGPVPVGHELRYIGGGEHATFGIAVDGKTYGWGYNFYGEIGSGDDQHARTPVLVVY